MFKPEDISNTQLITELLDALQRMCVMHEVVMKKTNIGASFYDAETITEMNEAPTQARLAIAKAEGRP